MSALVSLQSGLDRRMLPVQSLGIASPCSRCTNRNTVPQNGIPACPRAVLAAQQQDAAKQGTDFSDFAHLVLTGLEANPFATKTPGALANPVYDLGSNSLYVWVARLVDNQGGMNPDRSQSFPVITDPAFMADHVDRIQCMPLPMVPADTLAQYYLKGRIKEGEMVMITSFEGQQLNSAGAPEVFGGLVAKISSHRYYPVMSRPLKDEHPRGT